MFGTLVRGAHAERGQRHDAGWLGRAVDTAFSSADVMLHGAAAADPGYNALGAAVRSRVIDSTASLPGLGAGDPVRVDAATQQQINVLHQQRSQLAEQQRQLQFQLVAARSSGVDTAAIESQLAAVTQQGHQLDRSRLELQATGSVAYLAQLRSTLATAVPGAEGYEQLLADDFDPMARVRQISSDTERSAFARQLTVALHVGVAELDSLRAQAQYLEHLMATGQLSPQQEAELARLNESLQHRSDRVELLREAREQAQARQAGELHAVRDRVRRRHGAVTRLIHAHDQVNGRSLADGRPVDWSRMTPEEIDRHIAQSMGKLRQNNDRAVHHGDTSAVMQVIADTTAMLADSRRRFYRDLHEERRQWDADTERIQENRRIEQETLERSARDRAEFEAFLRSLDRR